MYKKFIPLLFLLLAATGSCSKKKEIKNILVILAHPDDEDSVAPVLAKYSKSAKVSLLVATDGRYGVREHAAIPAGDSLVAVRKLETECSCKTLGIEPPIFLGFHDGMGMVTGMGEYFKQTHEMKEKIKEKIESINPDIIITFGPEGNTGHPDHKGIGDLTTEIILREGWYEKYPLYYIAWSKNKSVPDSKSLNYVDDKYLDVRIAFSQADKEKFFQALQCYKTQYTQAEMNNWIKADQKDSANIFYFRRFMVSGTTQTEF